MNNIDLIAKGRDASAKLTAGGYACLLSDLAEALAAADRQLTETKSVKREDLLQEARRCVAMEMQELLEQAARDARRADVNAAELSAVNEALSTVKEESAEEVAALNEALATAQETIRRCAHVASGKESLVRWVTGCTEGAYAVDEVRALRASYESCDREMRRVRPLAEAYHRTCQTFGIQSDVIGYVRTVDNERDSLTRQVARLQSALSQSQPKPRKCDTEFHDAVVLGFQREAHVQRQAAAKAILERDAAVSIKEAEKKILLQEIEAHAVTKAEVVRLREGKFTKDEIHDICHNLHGKVDACAFAAGCAAEQRKLYGVAPDADKVAELQALVRDQQSRLEAAGKRISELGSLESRARLAMEVEKNMLVENDELRKQLGDPNYYSKARRMLDTLSMAYRYILGIACTRPLDQDEQRELGRRLAAYHQEANPRWRESAKL